MRRLIVFNSVSLDGYFVDANGDMSWAHQDDKEMREFAEGNAKGDGVLVFGRITYGLMAGYWPTPAAITSAPVLAERMNSRPKVVFSTTLEKASWNNTTLVKGDAAVEMRKMKQEPGRDMAILGSGRIVSRLAQEGLIDEYQMLVVPVVLGGGRTMFDGIKGKLALRRVKSRSFGNGSVFLCYQPET